MNRTNKELAKNRNLMKKSTPIILLGVAIMGGLSVYVIGNNPSLKEAMDAERPVDRKTIVSLSVFEYSDKRKTETASVKGNTNLVFDLSSNVPVHVALLASKNGQSPKILFQDARIPPGPHKDLEKAGDKFIYKTLAQEGHIQFCLVQANTTAELTSKLLRPKNIWHRIPESQCVDVVTE